MYISWRFIGCLTVCSALLTACSFFQQKKTEVTLTDFEQIEMGMTYQEVVDIFGFEGELQSEFDGNPLYSEIYLWEGNGARGQVILVFQEDRLIHRQQTGLE